MTADVAMLFSWESWWAADAENRPNHALGYLDQVHALYGALRDLGHTVDVVRPGADLSRYRLVVVPGLHLVSDADARALDGAAATGTHVVVTFYSGIVDENDRVRPGGHPGAWRDLLGVRVEEFAPVLPGTAVALDTGATATMWTERMSVTDATVVARFADGPSAGLPAITRRSGGSAGTGDAWYLATLLDPPALRELLAAAAEAAGVVVEPGAGRGVDVIRRRGDDRSYRFVINNTDQSVEIDAVGEDLVTGSRIAGTVVVPAGGVRVIREQPTEETA